MHGPRWGELYPTLDLHGETGESAAVLAERWLRDRQLEGTRRVRIVTGRGLHSIGPPVLPGEIAGLLDALKGSIVERSERERGGGSFLVELRAMRPPPGARSAIDRERSGRAPRPGHHPVAAEPSHDADLRRRAEESLAELGVTPTAELIAVEMKRLRGGG